MCMVLQPQNSILVVSFATEKMTAGSDSVNAAIEAGYNAFSARADDCSGHDHRHGANGSRTRGRGRTGTLLLAGR